MLAYTYLITFLPTNQLYYGVRFAKWCAVDDLWNTYFTSSKTIHRLIEEHGKEQFVAEVRKIFSNKEDALRWENKFLTKVDALHNPLFLNKNIGGQYFDCTGMKKPKQSEFMKTNNPAKIPGVMDCIKGDNNPAKKPEVKKKISENNASRRPEVKEMRRQHMLLNNPAKCADTKEKIRQAALNRVKIICSHCGKSATPGMFARWHGDKCKKNIGE